MKSDKIEMDRRIRIVVDLILRDYFSEDIVNECISKWGVSDRQARRYIAEAHEKFEDVTKDKLANRLSYHIAKRKKLLVDMDPGLKNTPQGIAVQLNILEDIADLERLYKIQMEHSGKDGKDLFPNTTVIIENPHISRKKD